MHLFLIWTPRKPQCYTKLGEMDTRISQIFLILITITVLTPQTSANIDYTFKEVQRDLKDSQNAMNSRFIQSDKELAERSWVKMDNQKNAVCLCNNAFVNDLAVIDLSFSFKFFGLDVKRVALSRNGSIFPADGAFNWIITPMLGVQAKSSVTYLDTGDSLVVQWDKFALRPARYRERFNFQAKIHKNGSIEFVYEKVPYNLGNIFNTCRCVDRFFGVNYQVEEKFDGAEPHRFDLGRRMDIKMFKIQNWTVVQFEPVPSCSNYKTCESCKNAVILIGQFSTPCAWCPKIKRCASMQDNLKNVWKNMSCPLYVDKCYSEPQKSSSTPLGWSSAQVYTLLALATIFIFLCISHLAYSRITKLLNQMRNLQQLAEANFSGGQFKPFKPTLPRCTEV